MISHPCPWADNGGLTLGILVAFLCLVGVGVVACIKRKTLVTLLFANKKSTIEKLR